MSEHILIELEKIGFSFVTFAFMEEKGVHLSGCTPTFKYITEVGLSSEEQCEFVDFFLGFSNDFQISLWSECLPNRIMDKLKIYNIHDGICVKDNLYNGDCYALFLGYPVERINPKSFLLTFSRRVLYLLQENDENIFQIYRDGKLDRETIAPYKH